MGKDANHLHRSSIRHHVLPVVVWLTTVCAVGTLFYSRSQHVVVFGLVQGRSLDVGTTCTGRIVAIPVKLFDPVRQGQTVAIIDLVPDNERIDDQLKSQLETISAEIKHLSAQMVPTEQQLQAEASRTETTRAEDLRRFASDVDNARLRVLELRALIETDRMTAQTLAADIAVTRKLVEADVVAKPELERLDLQYQTIQTTIKENEALLEQAKTNLGLAQQRHDAFAGMAVQHPSVDKALEVIRREIEVQERMMNEITIQLATLRSQQTFELKAPLEGVVSQIAMGVGDVADVNVPILRITQAGPTEVLAYMDETQTDLVRQGATVEMVKAGPPPVISKGQVIAVGPVMEQLPPQLWRNPSIPQWGRPFLIKAPTEMKLLVGERVGIQGM